MQEGRDGQDKQFACYCVHRVSRLEHERACASAAKQHEFLRHQRRTRKRWGDGLEGADRHCQSLAQAAGAGGKTWRAYLSTQGTGAVNARDRIGKGPWQNAKGIVIANNVTELHSANNLNKQTALTEKGDGVNGVGDTPNRHDVLTGSQVDGTAFPGADDRTCKNWTSSTQGAAMLGHLDRRGLNADAPANDPSRGPDGGCSQADLRSTGGDGLLYCFAAN